MVALVLAQLNKAGYVWAETLVSQILAPTNRPRSPEFESHP